MSNCIEGTLTAYGVEKWTKKDVLFFFRRCAFSIPFDRIAQHQNINDVSNFVSQQFSLAETVDKEPRPDWADWTLSDYTEDQQFAEQRVDFFTNFLKSSRTNGIRTKFILFWSGHFTTQLNVYECSSYMWQYYEVLERNCFGSFKTFVKEIGLTNAMLIYLNGVQNTKTSPNENYARELYELFTLGRDNGYTQNDIAETARALTGYNGFVEGCASLSFLQSTFDDGKKTIFGRTGNWGYNDVIDILFEEKGTLIAKHICEKIYRFFVSHNVSENIINELSTLLIDNNWELKPLFERLFSSEHFFDSKTKMAQIKSPAELFLSIANELKIPVEDSEYQWVYFGMAELGYELFNPPDVAGWARDREWINNSSILQRQSMSRNFPYLLFDRNKELLVNFAKSLDENHTDVDSIVQNIGDFYLANSYANEENLMKAVIAFKGPVPENYFEAGNWSLDFEYADYQVALLIDYIFSLPEFQLH